MEEIVLDFRKKMIIYVEYLKRLLVKFISLIREIFSEHLNFLNLWKSLKESNDIYSNYFSRC